MGFIFFFFKLHLRRPPKCPPSDLMDDLNTSMKQIWNVRTELVVLKLFTNHCQIPYLDMLLYTSSFCALLVFQPASGLIRSWCLFVCYISDRGFTRSRNPFPWMSQSLRALRIYRLPGAQQTQVLRRRPQAPHCRLLQLQSPWASTSAIEWEAVAEQNNEALRCTHYFWKHRPPLSGVVA